MTDTARTPGAASSDARASVANLLAALLAADRHRAERVIDDALFELRDGIAVLDDVLAPAMREVGRLWEAGRITVADEHLATAIAHSTLTRVYPNLVSADPRSRGTALLAGADGEQHLLGLRMVADVLEGGGFDVRNIGGSLPPDALAAAVSRHHPVLVGLADTMGGDAILLRCVEAIRSRDPLVPILLGGAGAAGLAAGDERIVVCTSARQALTEALRLTGG